MGEICNACGRQHESFRLTVCMEHRKGLQAYVGALATLDASEQIAAVDQKALQAYTESMATLIASGQSSRRSEIYEGEQNHRSSIDSLKKGQVLKKRPAGTIDAESAPRAATTILGGRARICDPPVPWHQILKEDIYLKPAGKLLHVVGKYFPYFLDRVRHTETSRSVCI